MIDGVEIKELVVHKDIIDLEEIVPKPGFLIEILRSDEGLLSQFGQSVLTVSYPGTIKAFHWHKFQWDCWFIASGRAKIVLYDQREHFSTYKQTQVIEAGEDDYKLVVIPPYVLHGYKVIGVKPTMLFYHTDRLYDSKNPDEQRIPYNDSRVGVDWEES